MRVDGVAQAGARVSVFAEPTQAELNRLDDGRSIMPLAQVSTGSDGRFEVRHATALGSGYRTTLGTVDVMVLVAFEGESITWRYTVGEEGSTEPGGHVATTEETPASGLTKSGALAPVMTYDLGLGTVRAAGNDPSTWVGAQGRVLGMKKSRRAASVAVARTPRKLTRFAKRFLAAPPRSAAGDAVPVAGQRAGR